MCGPVFLRLAFIFNLSIFNSVHAFISRRFVSSNTFISVCTTVSDSKLSDFRSVSHIHHTEYPDDNYSHILGINDPTHSPSKLQSISALRLKDVIRNKKPIDTQGCGIDRSFYISSDEYNEQIREFDETYGKPLNLFEHISSKYPQMAIAAEFKRASPSKGIINLDLDVVEQCLQYAEVGAAVISVLTEFEHFKGTLADMKKVRLATQKQFKNSRPAILRKDFILDRYQILEARANGADTVLLIVAVLGVHQLQDLMQFCHTYGIEPLVEVHTDEEMEIALDCGARVIGVNNRNLHTFQLDLGTTERVIKIAERRGLKWSPPHVKASSSFPPPPTTTTTTPPPSTTTTSASSTSQDIIIAALSGISVPEDVRRFRAAGVSCCLIGEALMKAVDPRAMIRSLLSEERENTNNNDDITSSSSSSDTAVDINSKTNTKTSPPLVKVCGLTRVEDAQAAIRSGAGLLGVIFASASPRKVSESQAKNIVDAVRSYGERTSRIELKPTATDDRVGRSGAGGGIKTTTATSVDGSNDSNVWFGSHSAMLRRVTLRQPLVVGINRIIESTGIDIVQLHGEETSDMITAINAPVIKVLHCTATTSTSSSSSSPSNGNESDLITPIKDAIQSFSGKAIGILLDTKLPGTAGGGAGVVFDWTLAENVGIPVLLAGGLTESNVRDAATRKGVFGVDVSSGVEVQGKPGIKDLNLVSNFVSSAMNK
eukprot:gene7220-14723_t